MRGVKRGVKSNVTLLAGGEKEHTALGNVAADRYAFNRVGDINRTAAMQNHQAIR